MSVVVTNWTLNDASTYDLFCFPLFFNDLGLWVSGDVIIGDVR